MSDSPIKTVSWFAPLADDHIRVGISRGTPRRFPAGFRTYRKLREIPGPANGSCLASRLKSLMDGRIALILNPAVG